MCDLTVTVIGDHGTVMPTSGTYHRGTPVTLTANPSAGYRIKQWTGTIDDSSHALTNQVIMNGDKHVTVEFETPRVLTVPGNYTDIQSAIEAALPSDTIKVASGVYHINSIIDVNKEITITSANPDDPCVVAATILDSSGNATPVVIFNPNATSKTVFDGFTIIGGTYNNIDARDSNGPGQNGEDGYEMIGGALIVNAYSSPTIKNCIIRDTNITGGNAGDGGSADATHSAGHGGWAGGSYGGGVFINAYANPTFINCTITNCIARGGNAGNGGNSSGTYGAPDFQDANHGGSWSNDVTFPWWSIGGYDGLPHYFADYPYYSGLGGGVCCNAYSTATFIACNITNNTALGGMSGIGGTRPWIRPEPVTAYRIPSFGGGVYCFAYSNVTFVDCNITGNTAPRPDATYHVDPYLGHGGGIAFEQTAHIEFRNCNVTDNNSSVGGGMYWTGGAPIVRDSNISDNTAYVGAGIYGAESAGLIKGCTFSGNFAGVSPNDIDVNAVGEGAGLFSAAMEINIVDCFFTENVTDTSGGGVYISGPTNAPALIKNCLFTNNTANRDGGAISANWYSDSNIANCTIARNTVTIGGTDIGFGGGLYCSYNSHVNVIDSIIWGNTGTKGAQLALCTGFVYDPMPSTADVSYSVIGPPRNITTIEPAEVLTVATTNDANVLANTILGPGIKLVGQPQYIGAARAAGTFVGGLAAGIGIESGIILTSGDANLALPPNTINPASWDNNLPGDPDLDALLRARGLSTAEVNTYDAAILEFTFNSKGGDLFFNFVFASDEYNEFVNSAYNDVFGFFLDGVNIALIPGTTTPVAINNVNGGNPLGTNAANSHLFHNNDLSDGGPFYAIGYDGFTSVFTAQAFNVGSGTHTIKLAIADTSDHVLDSAVFIEAGSFSDKALYSDPIYVGSGCAISGWDPNASDPNKWDPNFVDYNNISTDPCFIAGYYLSQVAAGQLVTSPCVDAGSDSASVLDMNGYTTRTDGNTDSGIVDMGYHYLPSAVQKYNLNFTTIAVAGLDTGHQPRIVDPNPASGLVNWYSVVRLRVSTPPAGYQVIWSGTDNDDANGTNNTVFMDRARTVTVTYVKNEFNLTAGVIGGNGTITPTDANYPRGTVVTLTADPCEGYRVKRWTGTDNDASYAFTNTVTMNSDRTVTVEFETPRVLTVPGNYTDIQSAIEAALPSDTIKVTSGVYHINSTIDVNKEITITSANPDDPCVVAATILDSSGNATQVVIFNPNATSKTVFDGFTIIGGTYNNIDARDSNGPGQNGEDGYEMIGGALIVNAYSSPTIKNCIIRDTNITGGNAGDGGSADATHSAGHGGWAGGSYGGGVFINAYANPTFINCTITNCIARGGNAGNGGNSSGTYGAPDFQDANHGGSWSNDVTFPWWSIGGYDGLPHYFADYPYYSGLGGGVCCNAYSTATFIACNITNNTALGGMSGIGGTRPWIRPEPVTAYRIPSFGGGVYCFAYSNVTFVDCNITGNTAPRPDATYHVDPYLGHGGGIAFEQTAHIEFRNCNVTDNNSSVGGGMYWTGGAPIVRDSNISDNTAYVGAGIYGAESAGLIKGCTFSGNFAGVSPNDIDVNAVGEGAGLFSAAMEINIVDCFFTENVTDTSGGGVYISGPTNAPALIKNCLFTNNTANRDGGAISANWYSDSNIVNCTVVNNIVGTLGGGLSSSYGSNTNVLNTIIWDNRAGIGAMGSQIAVSSGSPYDNIPATVQVHYSDVQDANDPNAFNSEVDALDFAFCIDTTGSMGADIAAVQAAARQITNAIANKFADYRIGLVNYRDYYDPNDANATYGSPGDWAYRDVNAFTTDTEAIIGGLRTLAAGGGADYPEAVYTALMHCIDANALAARLTANGQARFIQAGSPGLGNWRPGRRVLRVVLLMGDAPPHSPEPFTNYVLKNITDAADGNNPVHVIPVIIRGAPDATNAFRSIAVGTGGTLIEAADANAVVGAILQVIDLLSQIPSPMFVDTNGTINWDSHTYSWLSGSHNINSDPCFIAGYYLRQIAAGQDVDSPCVDTGSDSASVLDMNGYTTRTDGNTDSGIVDMGYHYLPSAVQKYNLTFTTIAVAGLDTSHQPKIVDPNPASGPVNGYSVIHLQVIAPPAGYEVLWSGTDNDAVTGVNNTVFMDMARTVTVTYVRSQFSLTAGVIGDNGTVTPMNGTYHRGTVVTLAADPCDGYRVKRWTGTDANNAPYALTNHVTMTGDKTVTVEFETPQVLTVPGPGGYTDIQSAIGAAKPGDTVLVSSGVYRVSSIVIDKDDITISSTNPDDPCVVAVTVIDLSYGEHRVHFESGTGPNTIFDGFTLTSGSYSAAAAANASQSGQNGPDGYGLDGGVMVVATGASPTIKNCVIRDTSITGGNAGNGSNADSTNPAGRGGWAGWAHGGGIYVAPGSNPTFVNCVVTNCRVTGGNGGNGGNSFGTSGASGYRDANYGGSWSNDETLPWMLLVGSDGNSYIGDYRYYSGFGGGVFCDVESSATFIACDITNNTAAGGMSGIGGTNPFGTLDPGTAYRIPSYGGGVYCASGSDITFIDCNIASNAAPKPDSTYHRDPWLGHGGGIAFEDTANISLINCDIRDNNAAVGGGMYWVGGARLVQDSNILSNSAYVGAGIYGADSTGSVRDCTIANNFAGALPGDVDTVVGQGGGVFLSAVETDMWNCVFNENSTGASGGGVYVFGPTTTATVIKNCLFNGNAAGRDGGAISVNWQTTARIENCTLYANRVTGDFGSGIGLGGGLCCSYGAVTDINNSIFWNDIAPDGNEIAVETGFEHDPICGTVNVSYSDIESGRAGVVVGSSCTLNWGLGDINTNPLFVSEMGADFHLMQISAGQSVTSPCVDAGGNFTAFVGMALTTTATNGMPDLGLVDMGYHYPTSELCRQADFVPDNIINFNDFAVLAQSWLNQGCSSSNGWCGGADLMPNGSVGIDDLVVMSDCWLARISADTEPPKPDPMTWAVMPHSASTNSVAMTATTASDISGGIEYEFAVTSGAGHSSGWQSDPCYVDTGLGTAGSYCYQVRAHDRYGNTTGWSPTVCVSGLGDVNAPTRPDIYLNDYNNLDGPDVNTEGSGEFLYSIWGNWWDKVEADVTDVVDDSNSPIEIRFICVSSGHSGLSSVNKVPVRIYKDQAVALGSEADGWRLTYANINSRDCIVYDVDTGLFGGTGWPVKWKVCAYDASGNESCSDVHIIGW